MATLSVQTMDLTGLDVTRASAAGGGDDFPNTGREYADVENTSGSGMDVTFDATTDCNFGFDHDATVTVPAGETRRIGPFSKARFGESVSISYTDATGVNIGIVKVPL